MLNHTDPNISQLSQFKGNTFIPVLWYKHLQDHISFQWSTGISWDCGYRLEKATVQGHIHTFTHHILLFQIVLCWIHEKSSNNYNIVNPLISWTDSGENPNQTGMEAQRWRNSDMPPQNMLPCHIDYFKFKALKKQQIQEKLSELPCS